MGCSCLYDLLRLVQLLLGLLCIALWITAALLGPDAHAVLTIPESPWSEFNINIWGPPPDLTVVIWQHALVRRQRIRLVAFTLPAGKIALGTLVMTSLLMGMELMLERQARRR